MLAFVAALLHGAASRLNSSELAPRLLPFQPLAPAGRPPQLWQRQSANVSYDFDPNLLMHIDWKDRSDLGPSVRAINIAGIALVAVVVILRIWLLITDLVNTWNVPGSVVIILAKASMVVKIFFVLGVFFSASCAFTKLSIICSFLRIFPLNTSLRRTLYVIAAIVTGHAVSTILVTILECTPVHKAWEISLSPTPQGSSHCIDLTAFGHINAAINIATDFARVCLILLFMLGLCTCVFGICRFVVFWEADSNLMDWLYIAGNKVNASVTELCTGIICVSITALRPIVDKLLPSLLGTVLSRPSRGGAPPRAAAGKRPSRPPASENEGIISNKDEDGTELAEMSRRTTDEEMAVAVGSRPGSTPGYDPQPRAKRTTDRWYELDLD
ncbi:hypothetical protein RB595_006308 [Gaeumannomyces hyphopodioides]